MKYTDKFRGRYRTSAESRTPGYLSQRMKIYARRERMRAAKQRRAEREAAEKVVGAIPTAAPQAGRLSESSRAAQKRPTPAAAAAQNVTAIPTKKREAKA